MSMNQQPSKPAELHRAARVPELVRKHRDDRESSTSAEENYCALRSTSVGSTWVQDFTECLEQMRTRDSVASIEFTTEEDSSVLPLIDTSFRGTNHHCSDFRPRRNPRRLARAKTVSYLESTEPDESAPERAAAAATDVFEEKTLTYGSGKEGDSEGKSPRGTRSSVSQLQESNKNATALDEARNWVGVRRHGDMYQAELELGQEFELLYATSSAEEQTVSTISVDNRRDFRPEESWTSTSTSIYNFELPKRHTQDTESFESEGNYNQDFARRGGERDDCGSGSTDVTSSRSSEISEKINVFGARGICGAELLHVSSNESREPAINEIVANLKHEEHLAAGSTNVVHHAGECRTVDDENPLEDSSHLWKGFLSRYTAAGTEFHQVVERDNMQRTEEDCRIKNGCKVKPEKSKKPLPDSEQTDELVLVPFDPSEWNQSHVTSWVAWCTRTFSMKSAPSVDDLPPTGKQLLKLTADRWRSLPGGHILAVHLAHRRLQATGVSSPILQEMTRLPCNDIERISLLQRSCSLIGSGNGGSGSVGGGQVQLWQFLLELLSDSSNASCIAWEGSNGEFKLTDPDEVARRWGERKSKPNMNYDKLSRALRYYYDKNIMTKVHGKRYAYKFDYHGLMAACQAQAGVTVDPPHPHHIYTSGPPPPPPPCPPPPHYCWPYPRYSPTT